ncbi:MAG: fumarylacetoacetate hydrolase family protein [Paludibacter sp.]|nr:fumarylacetoacetate hydrolase family protein [Paludibacter sp.]
MKIIVFENIFDKKTLLTKNIEISFRPDSTLSKGNKPFFVPEFSDDFSAQIFVAIEVSKLGKNIEERFAHRYYNKFAFVICLTANDLVKDIKMRNLAISFDGSTALSNFYDIKNIDFKQIKLEFHFNENIDIIKNFDNFIDNINQLIVYASKFCTLKTGDLLLLKLNFDQKKIKIGDKISIFFNNNKILEQKIK